MVSWVGQALNPFAPMRIELGGSQEEVDLAAWLDRIVPIKGDAAAQKYATCLVGDGIETVEVRPVCAELSPRYGRD